jgi:hypothetical protein
MFIRIAARGAVRRVLGALALLVLFTTSIEASTVTLVWDANTEQGVAGYVVYYGTMSGVYGNTVDVGNQTTYSATGLTAGRRYYFAVLAYNVNGLQSPLSLEVSTIALPTTARLTINLSANNITSGGSATVAAQAYDAVGNPVAGIPFTWATSNASVATLAATSGATNTVTGNAAGVASITVNGGDEMATATVAVSPPVARVVVSPSTANLKVGEATNLTAQAFDSTNNPLPAVPLTWSTGNSSVVSLTTTTGATVPITAAGAGATSVTVGVGGVVAAATISVSAAPAVSRVTITPTSSNLVPAQTQQFVAIAYDATNAPFVATSWRASPSNA